MRVGPENDLDGKVSTELGKALNMKERKFVREYLVDLNGTQAAIRAGYSEKSAASTASRLLRRENVKAYRDALMQETFEAIGITKHSIAAEVWEIYRKCCQKEPVLAWDPASGEWVESGEWQFNVKGALKALEMLNKMLPNMKDDNGKDTGSGGLEELLMDGGTGGREF